jgi:hypothetical protein
VLSQSPTSPIRNRANSDQKGKSSKERLRIYEAGSEESDSDLCIDEYDYPRSLRVASKLGSQHQTFLLEEKGLSNFKGWTSLVNSGCYASSTSDLNQAFLGQVLVLRLYFPISPTTPFRNRTIKPNGKKLKRTTMNLRSWVRGGRP